jgi:hypothetical protein
MSPIRRARLAGMLTGLALAFLMVALLGASDCSNQSKTEKQDRAAADATMTEMRAQVGLPNITNFTEARFARQIAELRDQSIRTWSYYVDLDGNRHLLCESIGYALPYGVQLTNPQQPVLPWSHDAGAVTIPLVEPNGLYMPDAAEASWVLCSDGKGGVAPIYSEPRLLVSPFPLGHVEAAQSSGFSESVLIQKTKSAEVQGAQ